MFSFLCGVAVNAKNEIAVADSNKSKYLTVKEITKDRLVGMVPKKENLTFLPE